MFCLPQGSKGLFFKKYKIKYKTLLKHTTVGDNVGI